MASELQFTVPGQPFGKERPRAARNGKFIKLYTPEKTVSYEGLVKYTAMIAMTGRKLIVGRYRWKWIQGIYSRIVVKETSGSSCARRDCGHKKARH